MKPDFANTTQIIHTEQQMRSNGIQCDSKLREVRQSSLTYFPLESNGSSLRQKKTIIFHSIYMCYFQNTNKLGDRNTELLGPNHLMNRTVGIFTAQERQETLN